MKFFRTKRKKDFQNSSLEGAPIKGMNMLSWCNGKGWYKLNCCKNQFWNTATAKKASTL